MKRQTSTIPRPPQSQGKDVPASSRPAGQTRQAWTKVASKSVLRLIVPVVILTIWWWASTSSTLGLYVVDPLTAVRRFFEDFFSTDPSQYFLGEAGHRDLVPSLYRVLAGLSLAIVSGVVMGVAIGLSPTLSAMAQPLIHLGRSLPIPALLGVFFFLFGTGDTPKIFLIAFGIVWPILFNTVDGVTSVGAVQAQAAQVFRIPARDVLIRIVLPGASPKIMAGIRTSLSLSLILMIISELQKSENGLGYSLIQSQRDFDYGGFWAVLIMLVVLGVIFNLVFKFAERRILAWHKGVTQQDD